MWRRESAEQALDLQFASHGFIKGSQEPSSPVEPGLGFRVWGLGFYVLNETFAFFLNIEIRNTYNNNPRVLALVGSYSTSEVCSVIVIVQYNFKYI